jgi:hypothetical protein
MEGGFTEENAPKTCLLVDTKGLVTQKPGDELACHKVYFTR